MKRILTLILLLPLSLSAQTGSEIYLFDLRFENNKFSLSNPVNITQHKGYDNQPFFDSKRPLIYYSSENANGQMDIKSYNYKTKTTKQITNTPESEFSPTITPDEKFISCIILRDNAKQDLGKYSLKGGQPVLFIDHLKVGYHTWVDDSHLILFVLADTTNNLQYYNLTTKESIIIASKPGRSLHKIPGKDAFSFIDNLSVNQFSPSSRAITPIVSIKGKSDNITWTPNGYIIANNGIKLFTFKPQSSSDWEEIDTSQQPVLTKISRLAVNNAGTKLAVVVSE